jgi:riboflavin biosynthesis pyrimidine reductase
MDLLRLASRSPKSVGANATLVGDEVEAFVRRLKADVVRDIDVAGPDLAASLSDLGLVDEYCLYVRPFVVGRDGRPSAVRRLVRRLWEPQAVSVGVFDDCQFVSPES